MSPEHRHQIFGGDIADYIVPHKIQKTYEYSNVSTEDLSSIYERQISGKPSIDTTGLASPGNFMPSFERDPHFQHIESSLKNTLNSIAQQIGLTDNDGTQTYQPGSINLKNQTADDLSVANNNVLKALEELKNVGAV